MYLETLINKWYVSFIAFTENLAALFGLGIQKERLYHVGRTLRLIIVVAFQARFLWVITVISTV